MVCGGACRGGRGDEGLMQGRGAVENSGPGEVPPRDAEARRFFLEVMPLRVKARWQTSQILTFARSRGLLAWARTKWHLIQAP